jgi:hypothetical protein
LDTFGLMLKSDTYNKAVNKGVDYSRSFKLDPKATSLRVVVRDLSSGNLGTLTIPLPVRGLIGK